MNTTLRFWQQFKQVTIVHNNAHDALRHAISMSIRGECFGAELMQDNAVVMNAEEVRRATRAFEGAHGSESRMCVRSGADMREWQQICSKVKKL